MKQFRTLVLAFAAAAALSCSADSLRPEISVSGALTRFRIDDIDSKALLTDDYRICWEAGKDEVSLFSKLENYRFTATSGGDGSFWLEGTIANAASAYYAVYPYNPDATNSTGFVTTELPVLQKAVPNQFSNIVAVAYTKETSLHFRNCVTLVEVDLQTDGIRKISFRGNNGELIAGTLRISIPSNMDSDPISTVIKGEKEVSISDDGAVLGKGKYYLAIIPQTFSRGVTIVLEGDGISARKFTLNPVTATRSKRLLTGALDLATVPSDQDFSFSFDDGNQSGTIYPGEQRTILYSYSGHNSISYSVKSSGYTAEYFIDGSDTPGEASDRLGAGFSGASGTIDLMPAAPEGGESANNDRLQSAAVRGSADAPVDLSTDKPLPGTSLSGSNTANCYVVRAPGWYSFPLVYGNAIKNGTANTGAFAPETTSASMLSPFIDANGNGISSPYINASGERASRVRIEWQDALGLVADDVTLVRDGGNGDRIVFNVPSATIREGNAVISALDAGGDVVWSWHIWVTGAGDEELSPVDIGLMRMNLGWVTPYSSVSYKERSTRVRLTENGSGKTIEFTILQHGEALPANENGYCPFWQWGRKDPFVGSDGTSVQDARGDFRKKTWYTAERRDTIGTRAAVLGNDIAALIRHPSTYNITSGGDNKYHNAWNATQSKSDATSGIVKTIYDPCPAGYSMPPLSVFKVFTTANSTGAFDKGWVFWTGPGKTGETISFPAAGGISTSNNTSTSVFGSLRNIGTQCSCWAGNAKDLNTGYYFYGLASGVYSNYGSNRQYLHSIRPILEQ